MSGPVDDLSGMMVAVPGADGNPMGAEYDGEVDSVLLADNC